MNTPSPFVRWFVPSWPVAAFVLAMFLHAVAALIIFSRVPDDIGLVAAGRPVAGDGVEVTLVAMADAPGPPPKPPKPKPEPPPPKPVEKVARKPPVLASKTARSSQSVHVPDPEPPKIETKTPPVPEPPEPVAVAQAAPAKAAAPPPAPIVPTVNLPGADAGDARQLGCSIPQPVYPPRARRLSHEGVTTVKLVIDGAGRIAQADVGTSSGFDDLDEAAVRAVLSGHCEARGGGAQVNAHQRLRFSLAS